MVGKPRNARAGWTLLEAMIGIALTATLLMTLGTALEGAVNLYRMSQAQLRLDRSLERALMRVRQELRNGVVTSLDPVPVQVGLATPWTNELEFQTVEDWNDGAAVLGTTTGFSLRLEEGETDDGTDEDGDGLVDELELVLTRDVDGTPVETVLARGVLELFPDETANGMDDNANGLEDEPGFSLVIDESRLTVRLALGLRLPDGQVVTRQRDLPLTLRN